MAKTSAKNKERDRRAVVEQMRRDQQRAERRRTIVVISACVAVALVIVALAAIPLLKQEKLKAGRLAHHRRLGECGRLPEADQEGRQRPAAAQA
jgi:hypothetical protein